MKVLSFSIAIMLSLFAVIAQAHAATDSGCYYVVNVQPGDSLNMRSRPSAKGHIVDRLIPNRHGVISSDGYCTPSHRAWHRRWCPVRHHSGDYPTTSGWVKAKYIRGSGCP